MRSANTQAVLTRSRWSDVGRGAAGLVFTLALAIGVPVALGRFVGWPLPREIPSLSDVSTALRDTYVPDSFLLKALAVVCWVIWAQLLISLLVEAVAYARGWRAGSVPLSGPMQRTAGRLVATVALLGALVASRNAPQMATQVIRPLLAPPEPKATLVVDPAEAVEPSWHDAALDPAKAFPPYTVQRYDTLWAIAEQHLGDPFRWVEIYELNRDLPQIDGSTLHDPDRICVGWVLRLPADAVDLEVPAPLEAAGPEKPPRTAPVPEEPAARQPVVAVPERDTMTLLSGAGGNDTVTAGADSGDTMVLLPPGPATRPPVIAEPPADPSTSEEVAARPGRLRQQQLRAPRRN